MTTQTATNLPTPARRPTPSVRRRVAAWLHRHPRFRLALVLALPLAWLGIAYLGSLVVLFLNAFWSTDPFTSLVVREFTLDNFVELLTTSVYRTVTIRTVGHGGTGDRDVHRAGVSRSRSTWRRSRRRSDAASSPSPS